MCSPQQRVDDLEARVDRLERALRVYLKNSGSTPTFSAQQAREILAEEE
jgi:hypothetical protein